MTLVLGLSCGALSPLAGASDPVTCTAGNPPAPYKGFCANYNGYNTWYGSYGLGFPSAAGWVFCATNPVGGSGDYPYPSYAYQPSSAPLGANATAFGALGFAFSQASASGVWDGTIQFTANEAAAAGKLLYDHLVWGTAVPSMDPGVTAAYVLMSSWNDAAPLATTAPVASLSLSPPTTTSPFLSTASISLSFAQTSVGVPNVTVVLAATNGTFANGTAVTQAATNASGNVAVGVTANGNGPLSVTVVAGVGQPGLNFWHPTQNDLAAQIAVAAAAPLQTSASDSVAVMTNLYVQKDNATEPGQGVPNATYTLFAQGTSPANAPTPPPNTVVPSGSTWWASGTTDSQGHLAFSIPAGYSWCVQEVSAPPEYVVDPALVCTGVITTSSIDPVRTVAVAEAVAPVTVTALKYNASSPGVVIPDATYALFVVGPFPEGFLPPEVPDGVTVPDGMELFATGTTDAQGQLIFTVPSGHEWCLQELIVPAGYVLDPGLHCTGLLTTSSPPDATSVALPEVPIEPPPLEPTAAHLAATGSPNLLGPGVSLVLVGLIILEWRRSARGYRRTAG